MTSIPQINFNDYLRSSNQNLELTDQDIEQIIEIVGYRCRVKTVNRLRSILTYGLGSIQSYGIFNRLIKEDRGWTYIPGQDYTSEIKTLRDCILGRI